MVKLNHIHLTFVNAVVKITHLEEILQIFYKVKRKKKPVYVFVHHPSYKDRSARTEVAKLGGSEVGCGP